MHHVDAGEQEDGQQDVHGGAGDGDEEAMPARVIEKLAGIVGAIVHGILAAHFDVTTQRDRADAVIGVTLAEAEQAFSETDGEHLDPDPQPLGHGVVTEFVDQDHEPEDDDDGNQRNQKIRHKGDTYSLLC